MTAMAEKLKAAGLDTFEARFAVIATEALRIHPHSVVDAWRVIGDQFGFEYLRDRMKDMAGGKEDRSPPTPLSRGNHNAGTASKPYESRLISSERVQRRREIAETIRSKYRCYDGRWWSDVGPHELPAMKRQGAEAQALLDACPAGLPNDGRSLAEVLGVKRIDEIIAEARKK